MEVLESHLSDVPQLKVIGEVDHEVAPALGRSIDRSLGADGTRVFLDLADCPYLDSGGLSVLLLALRHVKGRGWIGIIAPGADLRRLFEIIGLNADPDFRVLASSEEAAALAEQ